MKSLRVTKKQELLKLDFGCSNNVKEGFEGVDIINFGQKHVLDLTKLWPWKDNSVEEGHASHFVEHLDSDGRIHFINELYRVLIPGGKCTVIVPSWSSCRAYGDLTHKWPPISEFWFFYLNKAWRDKEAPHSTFYKCDFDVTWGYNLHQLVISRNQEYQQHAVTFWKEAAQDIIATFTKKGE